eukprot:CAMPEP_0197465720 /NCGR_PEP_ID=MMETSP1175-20131217/64677_1 /TAXON_ID=1003142 /ORGANISM="Triceratium dubium, Strain CCMP147" /LENGTH=1211 /DNA_ID=CAMNT_0043001739 /DNA_START=686 /DNA_END=4321 /DNA_ORIENTATION=+
MAGSAEGSFRHVVKDAQPKSVFQPFSQGLRSPSTTHVRGGMPWEERHLQQGLDVCCQCANPDTTACTDRLLTTYVSASAYDTASEMITGPFIDGDTTTALFEYEICGVDDTTCPSDNNAGLSHWDFEMPDCPGFTIEKDSSYCQIVNKDTNAIIVDSRDSTTCDQEQTTELCIVLGDNGCSHNFGDLIIKCDNTAQGEIEIKDGTDPPYCGKFFIVVTVSDGIHLGYSATVAKPGSTCSSSCIQGPVCDNLRDEPPEITCPPPVEFNCESESQYQDVRGGQTVGTASVTDDCQVDEVETSFSDGVEEIGICNEKKYFLRTWTATDFCATTDSCEQKISLFDNTAPTITCPSDFTEECSMTQCTEPECAGVATADDNCYEPTLTYEDSSMAGTTCMEDQVVETITRVWTANDGCNDSPPCPQTIEVKDRTPPVITCPADIEIDCDESTDPADTGVVDASDSCGTPATSYSDEEMGKVDECPEEYTITRTWYTKDGCNPEVSCTQTIEVKNTPPSITCPANIIDPVEYCNLQLGTPTSSDDCGGTYSITPPDVTEFRCEASGDVEWTSTDNCGDVSSCQQSIAVKNTPPTITCPDPDTMEWCDCSDTPEGYESCLGTATATDVCGSDPSVGEPSIVRNVDACLKKATVTGTWTAIDECDATSQCDQVLTIVDSPPEITCPASVEIDCDESTLPANTGVAVASDLCERTSDPEKRDEITGQGDTCPEEYTITRTWYTKDDCNPEVSCTQTIEVKNTPPSITCPANIIDPVEYCNLQLGTPTSSDDCGGTYSITPPDVTEFRCEASGDVEWTSTDNCGDVSSCQQSIAVKNTPPTITCPDPVTVVCGTCIDSSCLEKPTVMDPCEDVMALQGTDTADPLQLPESSPDDVTQVFTRNWSATDECEQSVFCDQEIIVTNNMAQLIVTKSTSSGFFFTFELYSGPDGFGMSSIASDTTSADDVILFDDTYLNPDGTYTLCELYLPVGWSAQWNIGETEVFPYNPEEDLDPPEQNGHKCIDVGAGTEYPLMCGQILNVDVINSNSPSPPPGSCGEPRTPGYWKNWNHCSPGNQAITATKNGGSDAGFWLLEDTFTLQIGRLMIEDCDSARRILDHRLLVGNKKAAFDPCMKLARNLLAALANERAGACRTAEVEVWKLAAQELLIEAAFDGKEVDQCKDDNENPILVMVGVDTVDATTLAGWIDGYNNWSSPEDCLGCL